MFAKKNKSRQVEFQDFLCGSSSIDYILQENSYEEQIQKASSFINGADAILVGAGAGASAAAGLLYSGKRFTENFSEFSENEVHSLAFCCLSTGVFCFPKRRAAEIAVQTVKNFLSENSGTSVKKVVFNVFSNEDFEIYKSLL